MTAEHAPAASAADAAELLTLIAAGPARYRWQGHDGRTVVAVWELGQRPDGRYNEVHLSVSHWGSHKIYSASINDVIATPASEPGGFSSELFNPMSATRVMREPVARFNRKKLVEFAKRAVAHVIDPANAEQVMRHFAQPGANVG